MEESQGGTEVRVGARVVIPEEFWIGFPRAGPIICIFECGKEERGGLNLHPKKKSERVVFKFPPCLPCLMITPRYTHRV